MDGWMDGVDLIICIALWMVSNPQGPMGLGELRSVSMASKNLVFETLF